MVAMKDIQAFSDAIVREFRPQRIILFGSRAYGQPRTDSDVDLLVEMPYRGRSVRKAIAILQRLNPPFAVDLLVRSPAELQRRAQLSDWFIREILERGRVLYDARDGRVGQEG